MNCLNRTKRGREWFFFKIIQMPQETVGMIKLSASDAGKKFSANSAESRVECKFVTVGPDLAKFCHFGQILKPWQTFEDLFCKRHN